WSICDVGGGGRDGIRARGLRAERAARSATGCHAGPGAAGRAAAGHSAASRGRDTATVAAQTHLPRLAARLSLAPCRVAADNNRGRGRSPDGGGLHAWRL